MGPRRVEPLHVEPPPTPILGAAAEARLLAQQLHEEAHSDAPLEALFVEPFLAAHAGVGDLGALFAHAGLPPDGPVDREFLRALGRGTLDAVARDFTDFGSWQEMEDAAQRAYVGRKLLDFTLR